MRNQNLPTEVARWVEWQGSSRRATDDARHALKPLVLDADRGRLVVRFALDESPSGLVFLYLEAEPSPLAAAPIVIPGVTSREAEVLEWVARGKTNSVIGAILGISEKTVDKHLQHVFLKLGVETRTAAAAVALERRQRA